MCTLLFACLNKIFCVCMNTCMYILIYECTCTRVLRTTQVPGYNTSISRFFLYPVLFFLYFVRVVRGTCTHAPGSTQGYKHFYYLVSNCVCYTHTYLLKSSKFVIDRIFFITIWFFAKKCQASTRSHRNTQ